MKPLVYIILVNYNGYQDTVDCLKSLEEISYDNYQVVVVDNGSNDAEIMQMDGYVNRVSKLLCLEQNLGFSGGNNAGIAYAAAADPDYILLLNNDTIVKEDFLDRLVDVAERSDKTGIVGGKIYYYSKPNRIWSAGGEYNRKSGLTYQWGYNQQDNQSLDGEKEISFETGCLMLIPMSVIKQVGGLEESFFLYSEDTDYCCRVIDAGYKILYTSDSVIYHKVSASAGKNSRQQQYYMLRNNLYMIKKYGSHKCYAYLRRIYRMLKELRRDELTIWAIKQAVWDFRRNKTGKLAE